MEKSGLDALNNFQYRMTLQSEGPTLLTKISPTDLACDTPNQFRSEEVSGYQAKDQLENWDVQQ